jgi:hypothetical protein
MKSQNRSSDESLKDSERPLFPPETPPCCSVWKDIRHDFKWYSFFDYPGYLCMPSLSNGWRVNFCPSCGEQVRNQIWNPK